MRRLSKVVCILCAAFVFVSGCSSKGELVVTPPATTATTQADQGSPTDVGLGESPGEVFLEPVGSLGPDPFTGEVFVEPVDLALATGIAPTARPAEQAETDEVEVQGRSGEERGLYGGTKDNARCDEDGMLAFLQSEPAKAAAWAAALDADPTLKWGENRTDLTPADVPAYFDELTPVVLTHDTRVTNHGFRDGKATPRQSVFEAGTAVLVDRWGVPRSRCGCGNPLIPPHPAATAPTYVGPAWPRFGTTIIIFVQPSVVVIEDFVLINVYTGDEFVRPTGTRGTADAQDQGVVAVSVAEPFPATAGIDIDAPYDSASFTVFIDPATTDWIAFSGAEQLVDRPVGVRGSWQPDGILDIEFPNVDDYLVVTATINGVSASDAIHERDAVGTPIGEQSVIYGYYPSVWYVSHIDWSTDPPTDSTATGPETGVLTEFIDSQGAGEYRFEVIFWNIWSDRVAHGPLYLLVGSGNSVSAPAPPTPRLSGQFFARPEEAAVDFLLANGLPVDGECGPDGAPGTYCWELRVVLGADREVYAAVPQFFEADVIWMLAGSGSAGWSISDFAIGGADHPF